MKSPLSLFFITGCMLLSAEANAHCCWTKDNPGYYDLRVELKNIGTENCELEKYDIQKGALYGSNVPSILPGNSEVFYMTLSGSDIDAILTYNCGDNKSISLQMQQYVKKNHKHTSIEANTANASNVFESHRTKVVELGCCSSHDRFGLVSWDLNN